MEEKIEQALMWIRPRLARHRGDIEIASIDEKTGVVEVRFLGTCQGCPLSEMTLKMGVESVLKERVPEITQVVAVT